MTDVNAGAKLDEQGGKKQSPFTKRTRTYDAAKSRKGETSLRPRRQEERLSQPSRRGETYDVPKGGAEKREEKEVPQLLGGLTNEQKRPMGQRS